MREIKFRAWEKHTSHLPDNAGTMWQPGGLLGEDLIVTFDGKVMEKYQDSGFGETWEDYRDASDKYVLMQYTGLKDKNGVEIYEGDIVRAERNFKIMDDEVVEPKIFEVIYQFASFSLASDGIVEEFGYVYMSEYPPEKMEVIGNIYQSPELLEDDTPRS